MKQEVVVFMITHWHFDQSVLCPKPLYFSTNQGHLKERYDKRFVAVAVTHPSATGNYYKKISWFRVRLNGWVGAWGVSAWFVPNLTRFFSIFSSGHDEHGFQKACLHYLLPPNNTGHIVTRKSDIRVMQNLNLYLCCEGRSTRCISIRMTS